MQRLTPDYKRIYTDLINKKFPEKKAKCQVLLQKDELSVLDVIRLNERIFGNQGVQNTVSNQKHRAYHKSTILEILDYQKENRLNNSQLANHFSLSRNTVAKWRKMFLV